MSTGSWIGLGAVVVFALLVLLLAAPLLKLGRTLDETTLGRTLKALGYAKLSARPRHHAQTAGAIEDPKKTSPPQWRPSRPIFRPRP